MWFNFPEDQINRHIGESLCILSQSFRRTERVDGLEGPHLEPHDVFVSRSLAPCAVFVGEMSTSSIVADPDTLLEEGGFDSLAVGRGAEAFVGTTVLHMRQRTGTLSALGRDQPIAGVLRGADTDPNGLTARDSAAVPATAIRLHLAIWSVRSAPTLTYTESASALSHSSGEQTYPHRNPVPPIRVSPVVRPPRCPDTAPNISSAYHI